MKVPYFNRRVALVAPFLIIFFFPIVALISARLLIGHVDWNRGIPGVTGVEKKSRSEWTIETWWEGNFQRDFSAWWEGICPGRKFFLRLFNQANYSFFRTSYMLQNTIIVGPDGQLDESHYIADACHQNLIPPNQAALLMGKLERLRAQLQQQGKILLVLSTPHKAITYPETIPGRFLGYDTSRPRPYDELVPMIERSGIPFVNGAQIIHDLAAKSPYPLFIRGSVHWDTYAAIQVLPALAEKISQLTGKQIIVPSIAGVHMVKAGQSQSTTDRDLATILNLLVSPFNYDCPNIVVNYPPKPPGPEPAIVLAGGSFSWHLLELLTGSPTWNDRPQLPLPFDWYTSNFTYGGPDTPISRKTYESALSSSEILVLEINEALPQATVDGLPAIIEESTHVPAKPDYEISFAKGGNSTDFTSLGFGDQESSFRWTDGNNASLIIPLPPNLQTYTLTAQVMPLLYGTRTHQRVEVRVQNKSCGGGDLTDNGFQTITATFPASRMVEIDFKLPDAISPAELKAGHDMRKLALAFYSVHIFPAGNNP